MARNKHERAEDNAIEHRRRAQYYEDRQFIARFLEKNLKGPQAATLLHRFWWYRCEDGEINTATGQKWKRKPRVIADEGEDE